MRSRAAAATGFARRLYEQRFASLTLRFPKVFDVLFPAACAASPPHNLQGYTLTSDEDDDDDRNDGGRGGGTLRRAFTRFLRAAAAHLRSERALERRRLWLGA